MGRGMAGRLDITDGSLWVEGQAGRLNITDDSKL
jgi:hypothetical protein